MKRIYVSLIITSTILFIIGCDSGNNNTGGTSNIVPTRAVSIYPVQNQLCTENVVNFQWNASKDANGDAVEYTLRIYTNFPNKDLYDDYKTTELNQTITLEKGKAYYWEVIASDGEGEMSGDFHQFYTESNAVVNYAPFSAEAIFPEISSDVNAGTTVLEWSCTDLDNDPLTYTVYFGTTENSLEMIAKNISETTTEVTTEAGKQYFWSVKTTDSSKNSTQGQTWIFYTKK
ncbi:MAG: hypothetical protein ACK5MD_08365 [Flavobacteriales bacterium]